MGVDLGEFPVMAYAGHAPLRLGQTDLRVKLEFTELTDVMADVDFKVFSAPAQYKNGRWQRHQPQRNRCLHRVRQNLRCQGPGLDQGQ